jgi:hypothetical protein
MPIEKVDGVWAETGTREPTLPAAKKTVGFLGGDQPEVERFNELIGRSDDKLDEIIEERLNSYYDGSADHQLALSTGIWPDAWGQVAETANTISSGGTKEIRDLAVFFNALGHPRLLLLDEANTKIEVWDPRTLAAATDYSTSDALTDDLPSGGGETWECESMCTDGTSVYCTFVDTNAAPDEHHIQAWDISSWNVKTGWPATGTALAGTGATAHSASRQSKVIVADSSNLAVACAWTTVAAVGDPAIQLFLLSDGTAVRDGAGDCTNTYFPTSDIVSDGTNIYFTATKGIGGNVVILCTATIADLTAGLGGSYPLTLNTINEDMARICMVGTDSVVSVTSGAAFAAGTEILRTHESATAALAEYVLGQDSQAVAVSATTFMINENCFSTCFDGVNFWALTQSDNQATLIKTDVGQLFNRNITDKRQWSDISSSYVLFKGNLQLSPYNKIVFDGRDIWSIADPRASQTDSGKIFRLPLALLRG